MENSIQSVSLAGPSGNIEGVACPGCGLLCDDLVINRDSSGTLKVVENGCGRSIGFFERVFKPSSPRINGQEVTLDAAIAKAADILRDARHPLISGLSTDTQGMRAVMNLAGTSGATIDHMNSKSSMRNLLVLQNSGWHITTLTEVRNRVDLLLVVGTNIVSYFPRFFERMIWGHDSMFDQDTNSREIVYLGARDSHGNDLDTSAGVSPDGRQPTVLPCDAAQLPEVLAVLRSLVSGKKLVAESVAGIAISDLANLAQRLKDARYSVVAWTGSALDFPHSELTIHNITGIVENLNLTTRSSGLPLGGNEGDVGAYNASSWISGYPFRTSYRKGYPDYEPYHYSTDRMLEEQEADALFWISSFSVDRLPPPNQAATVVIGHPNMKLDVEPDVFIPIAIPGLDSRGIQFRSDSSVALPLKKLRESDFPTLTSVLSSIEAAL